MDLQRPDSSPGGEPWQRLQGVRRILDRRVHHDQAVGVLMQRRGCTPEAAARLLAGAAVRLDVPEHLVATALVDSVTDAEDAAPLV